MPILAQAGDTLKPQIPGCGPEGEAGSQGLQKIVLVGSPNVGKSVIFNYLTGQYATVSNYPGTTVEVSRGTTTLSGRKFEVIDTPGMYSLMSITGEEKVTQAILLEERPAAVLHVVDAKNLSRMLALTLQLIEAGLPVILVLNIMDEAERLGMAFDLAGLEKKLGIPVLATVSVAGKGMNHLKRTIESLLAGRGDSPPSFLHYDAPLELGISEIELCLKDNLPLSRRSIATLLLQEEADILERAREAGADAQSIRDIVSGIRGCYPQSLNYVIAMKRQQAADELAAEVVRLEGRARTSPAERLSRLTTNPWTGLPILLAVLYFGLYKFVGGFGAGIVVDFLEHKVFGEYVTPPVVALVQRVLPWQTLQSLFVGDYGIITLGIRYAIALILPIVGTFFLVFAIIEDTGYLPRLALLIDRLFKKIGLSGRAVIPMVLGLGCDTMATMVTRTLPTVRERVIATLLLALAVPCSAQLGVILGLLESHPRGLLVWTGVIIGVFLLVGFLAARIMPGEKPVFFMEVPPLRWPKLSNVLIKTYSRMAWYFKEILPLFVLASILIWLGELTGLFGLLTKGLSYPVQWLGLPEKTSVAFLFGFFRRDYGAAGLYDMHKAGLLSGNQLTVAAVTMTLFLPCVAQFLMTIKERGWRTGVGISVFILFFAFGAGFLLNAVLNAVGATL